MRWKRRYRNLTPAAGPCGAERAPGSCGLAPGRSTAGQSGVLRERWLRGPPCIKLRRRPEPRQREAGRGGEEKWVGKCCCVGWLGTHWTCRGPAGLALQRPLPMQTPLGTVGGEHCECQAPARGSGISSTVLLCSMDASAVLAVLLRARESRRRPTRMLVLQGAELNTPTEKTHSLLIPEQESHNLLIARSLKSQWESSPQSWMVLLLL